MARRAPRACIVGSSGPRDGGAAWQAAARNRASLQIVYPDSPGWDEARQAWNLAVDQQPEAVVARRSPSTDVVAAVELARARGWRIAPQATGHGAAPLGSLAGTLLLKTDRLRGVTVDPAARIARVEAGALWQDVAEAAAPHGLAALAGSSPDVGVVGYTLGGGLSWLGRLHGLAANSVTAAELVTADGQGDPRRRRPRARPLLGAARRRRQLRRRDRARAAPLPARARSTRASSGGRSSGRATCCRRGAS